MTAQTADWTEFFTDLNFTDFIFTDLIIHARGLSVTVMSVKIMSDKVCYNSNLPIYRVSRNLPYMIPIYRAFFFSNVSISI